MEQSKEDIDKKFDIREHKIDRWGKLFLKVVGVGGAVIIAVLLAYSQLKGHVAGEEDELKVEQGIEEVKELAPVEELEEAIETEELYVVESYYWTDQVTGIEYLIRVWSDGVEEEIELH